VKGKDEMVGSDMGTNEKLYNYKSLSGSENVVDFPKEKNVNAFCVVGSYAKQCHLNAVGDREKGLFRRGKDMARYQGLAHC